MGPPSAKPCQCKLYNYLATAMKSYNAFHLLNFYSMVCDSMEHLYNNNVLCTDIWTRRERNIRGRQCFKLLNKYICLIKNPWFQIAYLKYLFSIIFRISVTQYHTVFRYCFPAILGSHGALPELVQGTATVLLYPCTVRGYSETSNLAISMLSRILDNCLMSKYESDSGYIKCRGYINSVLLCHL